MNFISPVTSFFFASSLSDSEEPPWSDIDGTEQELKKSDINLACSTETQNPSPFTAPISVTYFSTERAMWTARFSATALDIV